MAGPGLKVRIMLASRRLRFRIAALLVRGSDGIVASQTAWQVALDRLAAFSEWGDNAGLSRRVAEAHANVVEDVTRLLVLAAEIGDPSLQLAGLQDRYVNIRMRTMSKRKRERLQYEAALHALESRIGKKVAKPPVDTQPQPPAQEVAPDGETVAPGEDDDA